MRLEEDIVRQKMSPLTSATGKVTLKHVETASLLPYDGHLGFRDFPIISGKHRN